MNGLTPGLLLFLAGGICALGLRRFPAAASWAATTGAVLGSVAGLCGALSTLIHGVTEASSFPWSLPYAAFDLALDPLSAFFMVPLFLLSAVSALYGELYLRHGKNAQRRGDAGFLFNLLVLSMALVLAARNTLLFLVAWELMALSSFALVIFEDTDDSTRKAGWSYLIASQAGTAFLFFFFILLGNGATDFSDFTAPAAPARKAILFVLALAGFGTKAGFVPLHVWLPRAHPAAPSHVSALMSGIMIKMGIYGILLTLRILGPLPPWCGWLVTSIGASSGVLGVLFALSQHDLKKLLAYHSVENIGIIALGMGLGMLGLAYELPAIALLGFAGAILHVVNHALFKGLLFLSAGSVLQAARTREMDHLGGLVRHMPFTAAAFLVGSAAICGLPPFNGFVSEFLIYLGSLYAVRQPTAEPSLVALGILASLALIGGLALACFAKAFSIVFLGHARSTQAGRVADPGPLMTVPMALLAMLCLAIGCSAPAMFPPLMRVAAQLAGQNELSTVLPDVLPVASALTMGVGLLILLVIAAAFTRKWVLRGRDAGLAETWGCAYTAPSPRMQYTSSSFASPIVRFFSSVLRPIETHAPVDGLFPARGRVETHTPDVFENALYESPARWGAERMRRLRGKVQHGHMNLYVLYIALTLLALLLWKLL
ncbi:MAG: Hydrogenase-4 component B [Verrucomicrobia bacterium ADurb.Bin345]|nr:MAG: Hydrogenase-4 component B [Verrucomicrobia bacterium ADurb.Bin345]